MITEEQYQKALEQRDEAEKIINEYDKQKLQEFWIRLNNGIPFTDDELVYSRFDRCNCGYGLAYPKECPTSHYWDCSAILKGIADVKIKHTTKLWFNFYSVPSETITETTRGEKWIGKKLNVLKL